MPIKDRVVSWYIQNILIPRIEIIDNPGFIITTLSKPPNITYLREIFLPEPLFELIETRIVEHYGNKGKQTLYSAGKKFGYLYASISNFPTINTTNKKDFSNFAYYLVRYIEGVFSSKAQHKINVDEKLFTVSFKDYIICRHNGLGYIMADGGIAGIWAYAVDEKSIEGVQLECQGRGDDKCLIMCGYEEKIREKTPNFFCEKNLLGQKFEETYLSLNRIRPPDYSNNSLQDLLHVGFFEYKHGMLVYNNIRFFPVESHILYILEEELSKLENGEQTLFNICFDFGRYLRKKYGYEDYKKFIPDFFPALGFGDITFLDAENIAAIYYPWTFFSKKSKYIIFRGMISGFVSDSIKKKIEFKNYDIDIKDFLTLTIKT